MLLRRDNKGNKKGDHKWNDGGNNNGNKIIDIDGIVESGHKRDGDTNGGIGRDKGKGVAKAKDRDRNGRRGSHPDEKERLYWRANELLSQPKLTSNVLRELREIRDAVAVYKPTGDVVTRADETGRANDAKNKTETGKKGTAGTAHADYVPYPWMDEPSFFESIGAKREFAEHVAEPIPKGAADYQAMWRQSCTPDEFRLTHQQLFLRNYISPHTPYNGLLVFHGTGVGKSCGAIAIAEQFKERRVFVITRPALESGFKANIYDLDATPLRPDGSFDFERVTQCTGTSYTDRIPDRHSLTREQLEARIARHIRNKYEFMGPGTFNHVVAAMFGSSSDPDTDESTARHRIQKKFSHSIIIVDEAHHLRGEDKKPTIPALRRVLENADDVKLILLTATPMFNRASDVVPLINLLRINDKAKPICEQDIFDAQGSMTTPGERIFKDAIRGYVSFMRGESPFTFPLRLWPSINQDPSVLKRMPRLDIKNEAIPEHERIRGLELCGSRMSSSGPQHDAYVDFEQSTMQLLNKRGINHKHLDATPSVVGDGIGNGNGKNNNKHVYGDEDDEDDEDDEYDDEDIPNGLFGDAAKYRRLMHAGQHICNIVYPVTTGVPYGRTAFDKVFRRTGGGMGGGVKSLQVEYRPGVPPILAREYIDRYAPKIRAIVDRAVRSEGVVMVYSRWIWSGLVPLAIALEHAGVERFAAPPMLLSTTARAPRRRSPWRYAIISGTRDIATDIETIIERLGDPGNIDGNIIKIVLLSDKGTEGLNLRYVREVHILEPWYHMNKIEQIVGRASRNCMSHSSLPPDKRNVTLYLHVVYKHEEADEDGRRGREADALIKETADLRAYRIAEHKQKQIAKVESIMRDNAVDCAINYARLFYDRDDLQMSVNITTSQRVQVHGYRIGDRPDMRPSCAAASPPSKYANTDSSTYDVVAHAFHLHTYRRLVRDVFSRVHKATYDELWLSVSSRLPDARRELAALALDDMLREGTVVVGPDGRSGRIVFRGDMYMFQPDDATTTFLSEWERTHPIPMQRILVVPEKSDTSVSRRGSSLWTMEMLEGLVASRISSLGQGLPIKFKSSMQGPLIDGAIDRLSHDEILRGSLALLVAETNGELAASMTSMGRRIRVALTTSGIISQDPATKDEDAITVRSPYGGAFRFDPELRVLRRCADTRLPNAKEADRLHIAVAAMQPVPRLQTSVFKMLTGGPRGGCVCHQTSTLTVQDMMRLIRLLSRSHSDTVPPGLNKRQMCVAYELLIRHYKPDTLIRPLQQYELFTRKLKKQARR